MIYILSPLCLIVGFVVGWLTAERYTAFMTKTEHEFDELFEENPHPELYNKKGEIDKGEYITMVFEPGFDPELWDPETDIEVQE